MSGVTEAYLFVSETPVRPGTATVDISSGISGSNITWEYTVGAPNATRYYWVEVRDGAGNPTVSAQRTFTTADNTAPTIDTATMALGTPAQSTIDLTFDVSDNDAVQSIFTLISASQSTAPTSAEIKTSGTAHGGNDTSFSVVGLTQNTLYYGWIMGRDRVGNESAVTAFTPATLTTAADTNDPTIVSFSVSTNPASPEDSVLIALEVSDT